MNQLEYADPWELFAGSLVMRCPNCGSELLPRRGDETLPVLNKTYWVQVRFDERSPRTSLISNRQSSFILYCATCLNS